MRRRPRTCEELGFPPGALVCVTLEHERRRPHIHHQEFVVIERLAVVVGDECGMKVVSYPYTAMFRLHGAVWGFRERYDQDRRRGTGNFTMRPWLPESPELARARRATRS